MNSTILRAVVIAALSALLGACAVPATPNYDTKFGEAVRQATALQTLNPDAGRNTDPVTGIDGESGKAAVDRYQESFKAPPRTFEVFDIGGGLRQQ